jgi:predicted TIM-barrel fold metal-dependent hydrolase
VGEDTQRKPRARSWTEAERAPTRRAICLRGLGLLAAGLPLTASAQPYSLGPAASLPPLLADYHLHIQGPEICAALARLKARNSAVFQGVDPSFMNPRSGAEALRLLDASGVTYGVLLSEAYMFGSPLMAPDHPDVARLTRAENAYNVAEAKTSGGRLVAFIGVDPLTPSAGPEIEYWSRHGAAGVKLHLANSLFDFGSPEQMRQLSGVFAEARRRRLPIIIHLRNRADWGAAQVDAFVDQVLPNARDLPIQVAHGAGWGALDPPTVAALEAFSRAIAARKPGTEALTFDLAIVIAPWTKPDDPSRFVQVMRAIGMDRFAVGSDWPAKYGPGEQVAFLRKTLPLSDAEWRVILAHRAKYLPALHKGGLPPV